MNHIDEKILSLYVLKAAEIESQRAEISKHLKTCTGCSALHREIENYYREVEELDREESETASRALPLPQRAIGRRIYSDLTWAPLATQTLAQRFAASFMRYPVRWSGGFVVAALAAVLLVPRYITKDINPAYARAKDEFLIAYDRRGEELWRKHIGEGFDFNRDNKQHIQFDQERAIKTVDVDKDGKNEIITIFGWITASELKKNPFSNVLICYNADGTERWKYEFHRNVTIGNVRFSDDYIFQSMAIGDFSHDGRIEVFAGAGHSPWFAYALVRLNANNGSFISEYWHNGGLPHTIHKDIDNDGVEEVFFAGQNNQLGRAALAVFDSRRIEGHGPAPDGLAPQGVGPGTEKYYILFPATDLQEFWMDVTNEVSTGIYLRKDNRLEVWVRERAVTPPTTGYYNTAEVLYYFDLSSMECLRVEGSNGFEALHRYYEKEGKLAKRLDNRYYEELRQGVRYWDGQKFVKKPVVNKRYLEAIAAMEKKVAIGHDAK